MNIRIWVYHNGGPVKVTIRQGKPTVFRKFEYTDEGYSSEGYNYEINGGRVIYNYYSKSRDCDGPLDIRQEFSWEIGGPTAPMIGWDRRGSSYELGIRRPVWQAVRSSRRDHYAERAGY